MKYKAALIVFALLSSIAIGSAHAETKFKDVIIGFEKGKYDADIVRQSGGHVKKELRPLVDAMSIRIPERFVELLERHPGVRYVEEDGVAVALGHSAPASSEYADSWGVDHIEADKVHGSGMALGAGINVAVIDTGIDYNHADLAANYKGGYDFVNDDSSPMDDNGHGSHVAGTIAAVKDGSGVVGVAPSANLYALKVLGSDGRGSYSDIVAALNWAAGNDMQIASLSLGGTTSSTTLADAVKNAYDNGLLIVAAAGNSGANSMLYPAAYSQVIAVGATTSSDTKASFSNYGSKLEMAAPGVSIKSTVPGGYATYSGTSMATPHVSGVAALVWSNGIATTNAAVRSVLQSSALDIGAAGRDSNFGFGLVRADRAVPAADPEPVPVPDTTIPSIRITKPAATSNVPIGTLVIEGTSSDNVVVSAVEVKMDTGAYATATPKAPGDWSTWTISISVGSAGQHRILSRATDSSGNQNWNSIYVNAITAVDTTKPSISITSPASGSTVPAGQVTIRGTASDSGSGVKTVQVRVDTGAYVTATPVAPGDWSSWSVTVNMGSGTHRILPRATDNAGNQNWNSIYVTAS